MPLPTIIVHSGVKTILSDEIDANQSVCLAAIEAGWTLLRYGGSAKDAVEAAIRSLEAEPTFAPNMEALSTPETEVFLDAGLMEGEGLRWGAIAKVQQIRHPISVARKLLEQQSRLLVGEGAERFAVKQECEMYEPDDVVIQKRQPQQQVQDRAQTSQARDSATFTNVGCVALDATGLLVAGTLAGGSQTDDRLGSTVMVGSGLYASRTGACATSGDGGAIMTVTLAKTVVDLLEEDEHPELAARKAIQYLNNKSGKTAGCIVLDLEGQIGWFHNSEYMSIAYKNAAMDKAVVSIGKP